MAHDAGDAIIAAARLLTEPVDRATSLEAAAEALRHVSGRLRLERAAAVRQMLERNDATAAGVAAELGISRSRLYKILQGSES